MQRKISTDTFLGRVVGVPEVTLFIKPALFEGVEDRKSVCPREIMVPSRQVCVLANNNVSFSVYSFIFWQGRDTPTSCGWG